MTDAHTHVSCGEALVKEFLIGRDFVGVHPWDAGVFDEEKLRCALMGDEALGVGEIGLDRLKDKNVSDVQREVFARQLRIAYEFSRPVQLHGAKCWGQVVKQIKETRRDFSARISFLFHGFSRSDGLIPEIESLNGFISIGPQILNLHAVNYREMARKIPSRMLLVETDRTSSSGDDGGNVGIERVLSELASLRGVTVAELEKLTDENAAKFIG